MLCACQVDEAIRGDALQLRRDRLLHELGDRHLAFGERAAAHLRAPEPEAGPDFLCEQARLTCEPSGPFCRSKGFCRPARGVQDAAPPEERLDHAFDVRREGVEALGLRQRFQRGLHHGSVDHAEPQEPRRELSIECGRPLVTRPRSVHSARRLLRASEVDQCSRVRGAQGDEPLVRRDRSIVLPQYRRLGGSQAKAIFLRERRLVWYEGADADEGRLCRAILIELSEGLSKPRVRERVVRKEPDGLLERLASGAERPLAHCVASAGVPRRRIRWRNR